MTLNSFKRLLFAIVFLFVASPAFSSALDRDDAVRLGRKYLANSDKAERRRLFAQLDQYDGDIQPVLDKLCERTYKPVKSGYHYEEHFSAGPLAKKHPDDLLYFTVPKDYRPDRSTGLIVFLHGGGSSTGRKAPRAFMNFPDGDGYTNEMGDVFSATGMIAVGPSAPWNEDSSYRWCLRESDEYLADVILECKSRFNIDPDRVILVGHSMGGFGAYHHILREPDRFAAVIANSGSWSMACWPAIAGTPLCTVQGVHDARKGVRWHYTDIAYGRWTDKLLTAQKIDHTYLEHDGKHGIGYGKEKVAEFLESARDFRRDPCSRHVVLVSPAGFRESFCFSVEHNRWLTLDESTPGDLEYDELLTHGGDDFDAWRLEHRTVKHRGAMIDAVNQGDNSIVVSTRNVARFTVWLRPEMIDAGKPVKIVVNGKTQFDKNVRPSLATALESYGRRNDWGLAYPIKIELEVEQ